VTYNGVTL